MKLTVPSCLLAGFTLTLPVALRNVAPAEVHWRHTCNRCCLPQHNYGHDNQRANVTGFAVAITDVVGKSTVRKPFHFRAVKLEVDHLRLDKVGLAIVRHKAGGNARLMATGRLTHTGGDGGLIGSNVTIRLRAYVGGRSDPIQVSPDAFVVWQSELELWVPRGQTHVSLLPKPEYLTQLSALTTYFDEITHLELEMGYRRGR